METAYILLGTNLGDRIQNLEQARHEISRTIGAVVTRSAIYKTAPWGNTAQPDFYNQIITLRSSLSPYHALDQLHLIEENMGRNRHEKWGPRIIDIDILFWGDVIVSDDNLTLPHPRITERKFVLIPLLELKADLIHPLSGLTVRQHLKLCTDTLSVEKLEPIKDS